MEKLSASKRKSIWSNFCTAFDSYEPPRHGYDYEKAHVIKSKLRCAYSAILLHKCGLLDESALPLAVLSPDLISQFPTCSSDILDNEEVWAEYMDDPDILWKFSNMNGELLRSLLIQSGWRLRAVYALEDYEGIPKWVINSCSSDIALHIGAVLDQDREYPVPKCLRHLKPDDTMSEFLLCGNLILWNAKIEKALKLQGTYPEKEEIFHYLRLPILDRYYPFSATTFPRNDASVCFSYILGDYHGSDYGIEGVELYGLRYEAVIGYLFADMAAEELLRRYAAENKGVKICNLKIA